MRIQRKKERPHNYPHPGIAASEKERGSKVTRDRMSRPVEATVCYLSCICHKVARPLARLSTWLFPKPRIAPFGSIQTQVFPPARLQPWIRAQLSVKPRIFGEKGRCHVGNELQGLQSSSSRTETRAGHRASQRCNRKGFAFLHMRFRSSSLPWARSRYSRRHDFRA
jgi:hypothetical protein